MSDDHTTLERYEGTTFGVVLRRRTVWAKTSELPVGFQPFVTHEYRIDRPDGYYAGHYFGDAARAADDFTERMTAIRRRHDA